MANQDQLDILKQDVKVWNEWRKRNRVVIVNLSGAILSVTDLSFANLSGTTMNGANLDDNAVDYIKL